MIDKIYPIGSIYITVTDANPGAAFGIGNWQAFGAGRTLVGIDASQAEFDAAGRTGGSKAHPLSASEMPIHTHIGNPSAASNTGTPNDNSTDESGKHSHWIHNGSLPVESGLSSPDRGSALSFADNFLHGSVYFAHPDTEVEGNRRNSAHSHSLNAHTHPIAPHAHVNESAGGGVPHNNLQPYITVYMWRRIS